MVVMAPREKWTDERLDDLNKKVDDGFARVSDDIRELRRHVDAQGEALRGEIKAQGEELRDEIRSQGDAIKTQGKELRGEIAAQGEGLRREMNDLRREMNERFDSANRTLVGAVAVIVAAIVGSNLLG